MDKYYFAVAASILATGAMGVQAVRTRRVRPAQLEWAGWAGGAGLSAMGGAWAASRIMEPRTPVRGQTAGGWEPAVDPSTGATYYYNATTQQTSWTRP
jgi:hypothetical protein